MKNHLLATKLMKNVIYRDIFIRKKFWINELFKFVEENRFCSPCEQKMIKSALFVSKIPKFVRNSIVGYRNWDFCIV
jgi:hypothetical protein